jgi:phosphatidylglycerophosphate synthase
MTLTVLRLPIGISVALMAQRTLAEFLPWLLLLILVDYLDGATGRRLGVDTHARRILDVTLDRLITHGCLIVAVAHHPQFIGFYLPLIIRDSTASIGFLTALRRGFLIVGDSSHRLTSLSNAALAAALVGGNAPLTVAVGTIAFLLNWAFFGDHVLSYMTTSRRRSSRPRPLILVQSRSISVLLGRPWALLARSPAERSQVPELLRES